MTVFEESQLKFEFDDEQWSCLIRYDQTRDYQNICNSISGTKGVDFIGLFKESELFLFEIKNYRGHRIESKPKIEVLDQEVAQKVRDTIAGIVGGARNSTNQKEDWERILSILKDDNQSLKFILWIEEDKPPRKSPTPRNIIINNKLKRKLSWLKPRIFTANRDDNPCEGLTVSFLSS